MNIFSKIRQFISDTLAGVFKRLPLRFGEENDAFLFGVGGFKGVKAPGVRTMQDVINSADSKVSELYDSLNGSCFLTFEALYNDTQIYFINRVYSEHEGDEQVADPLEISVSNDGKVWRSAESSRNADEALVCTLNRGEKLYVRGLNGAYGFSIQSQGDEVVLGSYFNANKPTYIYGNVLSLITGKSDNNDDYDISEECALAGIFAQIEDISEASSLCSSRNFLSHPFKKLIINARSVSNECCKSMFYGCSSITESPIMTATEISYGSYKSMFYGCESLIKAPELFATTLATECYRKMFAFCRSLSVAPILPATELTMRCYAGMFIGCLSLSKAPGLPATTLAAYCYSSMFSNCTGLTSAPKLPATTLAESCYSDMFSDCTGLTTAPELPATTLTRRCYYSMFAGCKSITGFRSLGAKASDKITMAESSCESMFAYCTSLNGFTTIGLSNVITLAVSCFASMFRGCNSIIRTPALPGASVALAEKCYEHMFYNCESLETITSPLPATELTKSCYVSMFGGCRSLESMPELPATTLAGFCYSAMFEDCRALVETTTLPATELANACYVEMFKGCRNLEKIDCRAESAPTSALTNWVSGVKSAGVFKKSAAATFWTTGNNGIPDGWTIETA